MLEGGSDHDMVSLTLRSAVDVLLIGLVIVTVIVAVALIVDVPDNVALFLDWSKLMVRDIDALVHCRVNELLNE